MATQTTDQTDLPSLYSLLSKSDDELAAVDPLVMNLIVAKGVPSLSQLEISKFEGKVDHWAKRFARWLKEVEHSEFDKAPQQWGGNRIPFGWECSVSFSIKSQ